VAPFLLVPSAMPRLITLCALAMTACLHSPEAMHDPPASAQLESRSGSTLTGVAAFTEDSGKVTMRLSVSGAPPGRHGVHLHETPDCSAPDASSAGGHWNPAGERHGAFDAPPTHLGDLGNLDVGADGTGTLERTSERWTVGTGLPNDVVGRSVIIHAASDDLQSQPGGNAGGRIGCAVIAARVIGAIAR
jgi:superoxide dismutase, Cu-Zn family